MSGFTYLIADLDSDRTLEELPLECSGFTSKLKGAGDLRAKLDLGVEGVGQLDLPSLLAFGQRSIYVLREGQVVWGGILWRGARSPGAPGVELHAMEFESYWDRRLLLGVYRPVQVDQLEIARALVAQSAPLHFGVSGILSGVLRDRAYRVRDLPVVGKVLRELADCEDGFDFNVITTADAGGARTRLLRFGYPRLGRPQAVNNLVFEGSILQWGDDWDAFASVTQQHEHGAQIGEGDSAAPLWAVATDDAGLARGLPLLQDVNSSHSTVLVQSTLDQYARTDLAAFPVPVTTHTVSVDGDGAGIGSYGDIPSDPVLGTYVVGDEARFEITDDWYRAKADGSPGLSIVQRILEITVHPADHTVSLVVGPAFGSAQ